jgi:hypothetical protein
MSDTWSGSTSTSWFTGANWSTGKAPASSAAGTLSVVISGTAAHQPVISPTATGATDINVAQTVVTNGTTYTVLSETQVDGQYITLTNGADLTIQGIAMGIFYGNNHTLTASGATMTGLHGALTSTPSYDSHFVLSASGTDTLTVDTINENFGLIEAVGTGNTLVINNSIGGNAQALHGLVNYGEISIGSGAEIEINAVVNNGSTVSNFYNAGWIVDNGGTLKIAASLLDGANTAASATSIDGYIEIQNAGNVILSNTVAAHEEVVFADTTANTLQITAGTLFSGTVANFGPSDTIIVNGFTSTSNATLTTMGGVAELLTTNGSVVTTITLAGSVSTEITTGTNASGQEFIRAGATTFTSGSSNLGSPGTTLAITNSSGITLTGPSTTLNVYDSLAGTGTYTIQNGATLALDNATGNDAGQSVIFGTLGTAASPNTLILNGNTAGFGGTITGFTGNDVIDLGASVLPSLTSGEGVLLSYNSATGVLTVEETASTGGSVASTLLTLSGTAAGALSTSSFVALEGNAGIEIETASSQNGTGYVFSLASGTGNFETPADFTGGTAPGNILAPGETVTIATGTAAVSGVTDNGTIIVNSTFTDSTALNGTGTLSVAAGGHAMLAAGGTLGAITDAGTLALTGSFAAPISLSGTAALATVTGNFSDTSAITGTGTLNVATGTTATLTGGASLGAILDNGTIVLGNTAASAINMEGNGAKSVADFTGTDLTGHALNTALTNFGTGDTIILGANNFSLSSSADKLTETYSNGTLAVTDSTDGASVSLAVSLTSGDLASWLTVSGASGALDITLCFYPGTALATPDGEMAVEDLRAGDVVTTANGPMPVRWVGQSHVSPRFADPLRSLPIRIRAGALSEGLPKRDLLLSPDHAIFLGGALIQASALVNGTSIIREANVPEQFTYYHVELATHELLSAEGVAAESFVDNVERMHFHNWEEREVPAAAIEEMPYPRAKSHRQVPQAVRALLALRWVA